jgi:hypothetical protein
MMGLEVLVSVPVPVPVAEPVSGVQGTEAQADQSAGDADTLLLWRIFLD